MIQSQSNARRMCATFHCIIWDHGTVILCNKSVIEVATLETFIRGGWAFGNWKHSMEKNTHKKWTRFPSLSLKGENRRVSNFFFSDRRGGGVATLSIPQLPLVLSTLRNPLSFSLDTVVDESPSASRKSPRVRHLIRYIHTHNTVWKRGGASSQQTCSFRLPTTTSRRNII